VRKGGETSGRQRNKLQKPGAECARFFFVLKSNVESLPNQFG
jgi:hypothetical protein